MKTNPNCTRPECPREFPDAQNFCNVCGEKLTSVVQAGDPFVRFVSSEEVKTFSGRESGFSDIDDVLQLPQEPFDPMKTFVSPQGTSFPSFSELAYQEAEEGIIDIPELDELTMAVGYQKQPEVKPPLSAEAPTTQAPPIPVLEETFQMPAGFQEPSETVVDKPYEVAGETVFESVTRLSSGTALEESKTIIEQPETIIEQPEMIIEQPETIIESGTIIEQPETIIEQPSQPYMEVPETIIEPSFQPQELPKTFYESPFPEQQPMESSLPAVEERPSFGERIPSVPFSGGQNVVEIEQSQAQTSPSVPSFAPTQEDRKLAMISLILGVLAIVCFGPIAGIPAIIVGYMAKNKADSQPQVYGGRGLAIAGMILGVISVILTLIVILLYSFLALLAG